MKKFTFLMLLVFCASTTLLAQAHMYATSFAMSHTYSKASTNWIRCDPIIPITITSDAFYIYAKTYQEYTAIEVFDEVNNDSVMSKTWKCRDLHNIVTNVTLGAVAGQGKFLMIMYSDYTFIYKLEERQDQ